METETPWWRGAVIYPIHPRSFIDSNHDGTGDLVVVTRRLEYVAEPGVDGIWIAPFFKPPVYQATYLSLDRVPA